MRRAHRVSGASSRRSTPAAVLHAAGVLLAGITGIAQAQVVTTCPSGFASTQLFPYSGAPATYTVPANVAQVRIIAVGADGGQIADPAYNGGAGARTEGTFAVTQGQVITVIAGQAPPGADDFESGGGGASGAYLGATLAVVAGGGGGDDNTGNGGGGTATNNGSNGGNPASNRCPLGGLGGIGGAGGQYGELGAANQSCQDGSGGAGGGGFASPGGSSAVQGSPRRGPKGGARCSIAGAAGGQGGAGETGSAGDGLGEAGGFGICGGGGADHRESGGGGGYSGGGGGPEGQFPGGGGSFVAASATAPSLVAGSNGGGSARNGSVRLCWPGADLAITKTNTPGSGPTDLPADSVVAGTTTTYSIVVSNNGPASANGAVVRDPLPSGLTCTSVTCGSATNGAVCPAVTVAQLQSPAGVAITTLPAGSSLTLTLNCTVQ